MVDRRDAILNQVFALLQPLAPNVVHNRGELPPELRPAILLFDGDEIAQPQAFERGRVAGTPNNVKLSSEIYVLIESQKPSNATAGQLLNAYRINILKAILVDPLLIEIIGGSRSGGEIRYDGLVTDFGKNRAMEGEMGIAISFIYPLIPQEL